MRKGSSCQISGSISGTLSWKYVQRNGLRFNNDNASASPSCSRQQPSASWQPPPTSAVCRFSSARAGSWPMYVCAYVFALARSHVIMCMCMSMFMPMCNRMHACMCMLRVCVCVCVWMHMCMCMYMSMSMYMCMPMRMISMCVCVRVCVCICVCTNVYYVIMCACVHMCVCVCASELICVFVYVSKYHYVWTCVWVAQLDYSAMCIRSSSTPVHSRFKRSARCSKTQHS